MLKVKPRFHLNVNIAEVCPGHAHCLKLEWQNENLTA